MRLMLREIGRVGHDICPKIAVRAALDEKGMVGIVSVKMCGCRGRDKQLAALSQAPG
jgi:hypothetical protein